MSIVMSLFRLVSGSSAGSKGSTGKERPCERSET